MEKDRLAELLRRLGEGDEAAQFLLLDYIMQQPEGIRVLALEALEDGGDDTYNQLMLTLADDPDLTLPGQRAPVPESDLDELHPIAQMTEREWQAAEGPQEAPPDLVQTLREGERTAAVQAARLLGDYQDPKTITPLIQAIRAGDRYVAAAAVEALQRFGRPAVPPLIIALEDPDEQVRWYAAKALAPIADEHAVPALIHALEDANYGIRWLAAEGLTQAGEATIVPLLRRLAENETLSAWLRQGAWHALNKLALPSDEAQAHYRELAQKIKRHSAATIPDLARQELRRLGVDA